MVFTFVQTVLQYVCLAGHRRNSYLATVLFGTVRAADGCSGDGASQLGVGAQHGVGLTRCSRTQLPDARRQFSTRVVLQYVSFPLTGTLIHLPKKAWASDQKLCSDCQPDISLANPDLNLTALL